MIGQAFRRFKHRRRLRAARLEIGARAGIEAAPHGLSKPLIVSLTSYPARFGTLALTLRSILLQSVRPDEVILWLDPGDEAHLPAEIAGMEGLRIKTCPPWRSYKKIVPTLLAHPDAYIVTADDDVYYPQGWLKALVQAASRGGRVVCHRAHRVALGADGLPRPYARWEHNITAEDAGPLVFLTGVSGVIYAPGVFHQDVTRDDVFTALAPSADDVWLYWMHRMAGVEAEKIGGRARIVEWEGSQAESLRSQNLTADGNDRAIAAMIAHYGWPD